jgi:hypothetical protein
LERIREVFELEKKRNGRIIGQTLKEGLIRDLIANAFNSADTDNNVVRLVPRRRQGWLNNTLAGVFSDDAKLRRSLWPFRKLGLIYVGDFVRLKQRDLVQWMSQEDIDHLRERLAELDLDINMTSPRWRRPVPTPISSSRRTPS